MPKDSDSDQEPNLSQRFWRHNSLMALRETREFERDAVNPEHLATIKANNAELAQLEAREAAVKARYTSIITSRRERGDDRGL